MHRYVSSLILLLSLTACASQFTTDNCDAKCDKVQILASRGEASAQTTLGRMYFNGSNGLSKDEVEAVSLWSKAAAQDYAPAENLLGQAYSCGVGGLKPDKAKAAELFQKAKDGNSENN